MAKALAGQRRTAATQAAALIATMAMAFGVAFVSAGPAFAATLGLTVSRLTSGTAAADPVGGAPNNCVAQTAGSPTHTAGCDTSVAGTDQILRVRDTATARFTYSVSAADTNIRIVGTLPLAADGQPAAVWGALPAACGAGSTGATTRSFTCVVPNTTANVVGAVDVPLILTTDSADGAAVSASGTVSSATSAAVAGSTSADYVASKRADSKFDLSVGGDGTVPYKSADGLTPGVASFFLATVAFRGGVGDGTLGQPVNMALSLASLPAGSQLLNWGDWGTGCGGNRNPSATGNPGYGNLVPGNGGILATTATCSLTGSTVNYSAMVLPDATSLGGNLGAVWLAVWTPLSSLPTGASNLTVVGAPFTGPLAGGGVNYPGAGEPGPNNTGSQSVNKNIVPTESKIITAADVANPVATGSTIGGGNSGVIAIASGAITTATLDLGNNGTQPWPGAAVCEKWDPSTTNVMPWPSGQIVTAVTSGIAAPQPAQYGAHTVGTGYNNTNNFTMAPSAYTVEYGVTDWSAASPQSETTMRAASCSDATGTWYTSLTDPALLSLAASRGLTVDQIVSKVRVTLLAPLDPGQSVAFKFRFQTRSTFRPDGTPTAGQALPPGSTLPDSPAFIPPGATAWTPDWTGGVNPRWVIPIPATGVVATPSKTGSAGNLSVGTQETFTLGGGMVINADVAANQTFRYYDRLPAQFAYVAGSATPAPSAVISEADGSTLLVWDFTAVYPGNSTQFALPTATYKATLDVLTPDATLMLNQVVLDVRKSDGTQVDARPVMAGGASCEAAGKSNGYSVPATTTVSAPEQAFFPLNPAAAGCTGTARYAAVQIRAVNPLLLGVAKTPLRAVVQVNEADSTATPVGYNLTYVNPSSSARPSTDLIDLFAFNGDGRTPASVIHGSSSLTSITTDDALSTVPNALPISARDLTTPRSGSTFYYTSAAPASISSDPDAASNLVGGATRWCLASQFGTAGCPATIGATTAVRDISGTLASAASHTLRLGFAMVGNANNDTYSNAATVRAPDLTSAAVSAPASFKAAGSTINGTLWTDVNGDGVVNAGETGRLAGVGVALKNSSGTVVATAVTNAAGVYTFPDQAAGSYTVAIDTGNGPTSVRTLFPAYAATFDPDSGTTVPDESSVVTVTTTPQTLSANFGYATSSLAGRVFNDLNKNGAVNVGEVGLGGVTVTLTGTNDLGQPVSLTTTTAATGNFSFGPLRPGTYSVTPQVAAGFVAGASTAGTAGGVGATGVVSAITLPVATNTTGYLFAQFTSAPALTITKSVNPAQAHPGDPVTYTVNVTNSGDIALTNVVVTDPLVPGCSANIGSLAVGAVATPITCNSTAPADDITNIVNVNADAPGGKTASATASATLDVIHPAITITKVATLAQARPGDTVTFTITVKNSGDVPLTSVLVTDPIAPSCGRTLASPLAPNGTATYTCSMVAGATDFTNTATAGGVDPVGVAAMASATAAVDVIHPALAITKVAAQTQARPGDTVDFTISVSNTGDVPLAAVSVSDPIAASCAQAIASPLAPNVTSTYQCSMTAGAADFTNTATATGTDPLGNAVNASASAPIDVIHPAVTITKVAAQSQVRQGDTVTFTITVTNTGDVPLAAVSVSDPTAAACVQAITSPLNPGASSAYQCSMTAGSVDFTNTAVVSSTDPLGNIVTAAAAAAIQVIHPGIVITKVATQPQARPGDTVNFTITVTNTGDAPLTAVAVTDPTAADCARTIPSPLGPNQTSSYQCSMTAGSVDFVNTATATATDPTGHAVTDSAGAPIDVIHPAITIAKAVSPADAQAGDPVTYTITVTNSGDVPLTNIAVTDPLVSACARSGLSLAAAQSQSWTCPFTAPSNSFTNTATATAQAPFGPDVNDSASAQLVVDHPQIAITKTADVVQARFGDPVTFTITVTNTGDVALAAVVVDPSFSACSRNVGALAVGGHATYTCTIAAPLTSLTNTAVATGTPPSGPAVKATDSVSVQVIHPAITITKVAAAPRARVGDSIDFTITVTNTGDVALDSVDVADALAADCVKSLGTLQPGQQVSYHCSMSAMADDFTNVASVTGLDPTLNPITERAAAAIDVIHPSVSITGVALPGNVVRPGDRITYRMTVTNTGDTALTGTKVVDPSLAACDHNLPDPFAPGATVVYTCSTTAPAADTTNHATVTGDPSVGPPVSAATAIALDVVHPAIAMSKQANSKRVTAGGSIMYTITVRNTGDTDLANARVHDPTAHACDHTFLTLKAGAAASYTCIVTAPDADYTNTATVTALPTVSCSSAVVTSVANVRVASTLRTEAACGNRIAGASLTASASASVKVDPVTVAPLTDPGQSVDADLIDTGRPGPSRGPNAVVISAGIGLVLAGLASLLLFARRRLHGRGGVNVDG
ncbi:DUF7507 domain-containing protein [Jatrophihabitans sp. DSM 45814]